jgi:putative ABC transport system permease protein
MQPYTFHINFYDLAPMATLFSGLTLALLLVFEKRPGQTANLFLSSGLTVIVLKIGGATPFLMPALGPLLYFYVRQLTWPDRRFSRKDMLHFCLLLVGYWMPGWLVLILVIIYLYLSHRLIQDFYRRLRPVLMDRPRFAFRRLESALVLLGLLCVLSLFNAVFYFTVAFVLIWMAAEAILKPDSNVQLAMPITDRSDAKYKGRRLKEAVATNRLYEDAELTLATLAVKLNIHPHDLSRIINVGLEKNFSDFINEFRVREIIRKMLDPAHDRLTLLGIAYESGFNSQRTFNRVFKEMTGKTPAEYKNTLKKELPIDKLATISRIRPIILRSESPSIGRMEH